jgi:hypothetical protein
VKTGWQVLPNAVIEDSGAAAEEPEEAAEEEESGETAPIKLPFRLGGQGTQRVKAQPPAAPVRPPAQGTARIKAAVQVGLSQMNPACIWTRLAVLIIACLVLL